MNVENIHERMLPRPIERVSPLLDSLSSTNDGIWPFESWPRLKLHGGLAIGAKGGHGPVRYTVTEYEPGKRVCFTFTGPAGFHGIHQFQLVPVSSSETVLRHVIRMETRGAAVIGWPLVFRPLHDALMEDAFDKAERQLGLKAGTSKWTAWVCFLRFVLRTKRRGTTT